ncbi:N-acetyltransferase [Nitrosomonas sp. HPC101]|uniref:N-acetyltransferase n=1 Tax=Nitrosomonas sp. HPC101 TaxID=1658667 RepID=UPI00136FDBCA|nr:N-acetyltransferase [Nitrosomonas sp. HPC101]MXS84919.1 N-acetyltransferase [Nitrosomonas sp. HPC101]
MSVFSDTSPGGKIKIFPISGFRGTGEFIDVPWRIYADDPLWVPPLRLERRLHFSRFNPYFKHAQWQGWVAYRNNQPVGRISAQLDELHRQRYGSDTGHFGMLESVNDGAVFSALIRVAEDWLAKRGVCRVSGPFNFSINQECGLLVQGFDTPPVFMMPYSPEWYVNLLEQSGYRPCKDLLAYWLETDFEPPPAMQAIDRKYQHQIQVRTLRRDRFSEEIEIMRNIFNDAWSENWGFVPFTQEEFAELGSSLRWLVPDEFIQIAEMDGEPVAFMAALPNLNEILPALNGKLFPFGWLHLVKKLKSSSITTARVPLMGVRRRFHHTLPGIALAFKVIDAPRKIARTKGIRNVELSWILEDNLPMRAILEKIGGKEYKRYRIYEKTLA